MTTRRDILKGGAFLGAAAAATGALPASIQRAFAIAPDAGTTYLDAEHIIVLMQENRSFDHMFGTLQGVRGFNDPRPIKQADGVSTFFQRDEQGTGFAPWRLNTLESSVAWLGDIPHGRTDQVDAWNGGLQNNWISAKRSHRPQAKDIPLTMGYCTREDLPFYYALADAFTVCDQNHCSLLTMTAPNRLMLWNGTVREPTSTGSQVHMYNHITHMGSLSWTSFGERLYDAGVEWKCYQNHIYCETPFFQQAPDKWLGNDGDNSMERMGSYATEFSPRYQAYVGNVIDRAQQAVSAREAELRAEYQAAPTPALEKTLRAYQEQLQRLEQKRKNSKRKLSDCSPKQMALRARGLAMNDGDPDYLSLTTFQYEADGQSFEMDAPKGDVLHQFRADVRSGNLPTLSYLVAPSNYSMHPGSPWYGEWYISEILNILTENPEVWKKCIFILTFDENDGFFDHAPTYVAADPTRPETGRASDGIDTGEEYTSLEDDRIHGIAAKDARAAPFGLGYRVPMIVASPWSRGGWVNSQLCDHTSVIQFVQNFVEQKFKKKVVETNISQWRRTICGDLTSCFQSFDEKKPSLPFLQQQSHWQAVAAAKHRPLPTGWSGLSDDDVAAILAAPAQKARVLWQEQGSRPACALPYELECDAAFEPASQSIALRMKAGKALFGEKASGAPFNVYLYGTRSGSQLHDAPASKILMQSMSFTVAAGDELMEKISLSQFTSDHYEIAVHGPNGFYRHFEGHAEAPTLKAHLGHEAAESDVLQLTLHNPSASAVRVILQHNEYSAAKRTLTIPARGSKSMALDLRASHRWYDFTLSIAGDAEFSARYAGHMENGKPSLSDPAMA